VVGEHRCPRGRESARPGPGLTRVERVNPASWVRRRSAEAGCGGRPTAMGAEIPAGQDVQEAKAGSRKVTGNRGRQDRDLLPDGVRITGRIPGVYARAWEGADVDR
jgi:hypothetical protein